MHWKSYCWSIFNRIWSNGKKVLNNCLEIAAKSLGRQIPMLKKKNDVFGRVCLDVHKDWMIKTRIMLISVFLGECWFVSKKY